MRVPDPARLSSISVVVRVRPFSAGESASLAPPSTAAVFTGDALLLAPNTTNGGATSGNNTNTSAANAPCTPCRPVVRVVDDAMLVFDPPDSHPTETTRPRARDRRFVFDHVFDGDASQLHVFERTARPLVAAVLDGFNGTVFAYGATGCGKTHTIAGTRDDAGVIARAAAELYERIDALDDSRSVSVGVSYLEIYNETIRDLLCPETPHQRLVIRDNAARRVSVANLLVHQPRCVDDVMALVEQGNRSRTCAPTDANTASLRSHAVLQINVEVRQRAGGAHTVATLLIIDLAGSERAAATRNRGVRMVEGANINRSLLALGGCINALCGSRPAHVPYRDLKLTRLLKFSLGGNCRTVMIVCVAPLLHHYDETWSALQYADRAQHIRTKVVRNRRTPAAHEAQYLRVIAEQQEEVAAVRAREARVVQEATDAAAARSAQGITEVLTAVAAVLDAAARAPDRWRPAFLLAKRRVLLVLYEQVGRAFAHGGGETQLQNTTESRAPKDTEAQPAAGSQHHKDSHLVKGSRKHSGLLHRSQHSSDSSLSEATVVRSLTVRANQLRTKIHDQILHLERQYDEPTDADLVLENARDAKLRRLEASDGWSPGLAQLYSRLVDGARDSFQKDVLVRSSVLFDYLVSELADFDLLLHGLADLLDACQENLLSVLDALDGIGNTLDAINNSDYDAALEERAAAFIQNKMDQEQRTQNATARRVLGVLVPNTSHLNSALPSGPERSLHHRGKLDQDVNMDHDIKVDSSVDQEDVRVYKNKRFNVLIPDTSFKSGASGQVLLESQADSDLRLDSRWNRPLDSFPHLEPPVNSRSDPATDQPPVMGLSANSAHGRPEHPSRLTLKPGDKRTSTSPLRSPRSFKKYSRESENSMSLGDADTTIDDSILPKSDFDDDSPLGNRIVDKSAILDTLDFNPSLNSPPTPPRFNQFDMSPKFRPLTETKLSPTSGIFPLVRFPLLNKLASTKVVHNGDSSSIVQSSTTPNISSNSQLDVE